MIRRLAPIRIPCTECGFAYRRAQLGSHTELMHPLSAPTWWARFVARLRSLFGREA